MTFLVPVFICFNGLSSSLLPKKVELNYDFGVWNDMMEWMHSWMVLLTHCNDSLKTEYNSGCILSSVPRDLKCPQQTLQKHVLRIQNHLIQDSSSSAGVPYMYVYIFFNSFGAILNLYCTDFYQTYILFFSWSCGREKFTLYCVYFSSAIFSYASMHKHVY